MTTRFRPVHSGFETLRLAGLGPRSSEGYHRFGGTNEQLTARASAQQVRTTRPSAVFADFRER
ncbi:hypothetical protein RHIZ_08940 [Rhizobium skierniewicense]|uniref:hypothetical protein n=1 Tax=Rhizobium TaxID=379 RepID=UPI00177E1084|nr:MULTISPECIES: hypothetical protein [Rhizobium]MBD8685530.1 hypothetical protein [Rhizobium sp. CFBP 13644]MBD8690797.1 hypothetical protein [Rhizobium sp. CFBP 13717]MCI9866065.1 hypothetical protein [Rhizobium skierniewicense]